MFSDHILTFSMHLPTYGQQPSTAEAVRWTDGRWSPESWTRPPRKHSRTSSANSRSPFVRSSWVDLQKVISRYTRRQRVLTDDRPFILGMYVRITNTENIKYKAHNQRAPIIRLNLIRMENIDLYKVTEPRHGTARSRTTVSDTSAVAVDAKKIGAPGFDMVQAARCGVAERQGTSMHDFSIIDTARSRKSVIIRGAVSQQAVK